MIFVRDTREQKGWAAPKHRALVDACLPFGDYSVQGFEARVCVERKGELDLLQSFGIDWARFSARLAELATLERCVIVAETSGERLVAKAYVPKPLPFGRIDPKRAAWIKGLERIRPAEVFARMAYVHAEFGIATILAGHSPSRAAAYGFGFLTHWYEKREERPRRFGT